MEWSDTEKEILKTAEAEADMAEVEDSQETEESQDPKPPLEESEADSEEAEGVDTLQDIKKGDEKKYGF